MGIEKKTTFICICTQIFITNILFEVTHILTRDPYKMRDPADRGHHHRRRIRATTLWTPAASIQNFKYTALR